MNSKTITLPILIISVAALLGCATGKSTRLAREMAAEPQMPRALIIFSVDGIGYKQLEILDAEFIRAHVVEDAMPAKNAMTFPGHTTIGTGAPIADDGEQKGHGIMWNRNPTFDSVGKIVMENGRPKTASYTENDIAVKPMWTDLAERGLQVRTIQWPLAYGPWNGVHHHKDKVYTPYNPRLTFAELAKNVLATLKNWDRKQDLFMMVSTPGLDDVGHTYGPLSKEAAAAWSKLRKEFEKFEAAMMPLTGSGDVFVIYAADHGMSEMSKCKDAMCAYYRRAGKSGDIGYHGGDPAKNDDLIGTLWGFPVQLQGLGIDDIRGIKPFVWNYFGIK